MQDQQKNHPSDRDFYIMELGKCSVSCEVIVERNRVKQMVIEELC